MTPPNVLLKDDFRRGLDLTGTWALVRRPPSFVADDGVVSASDQGLHVKAAGTNPLTGEPAFSKTLPGSAEDHVKWMADTRHLSSNSMPGFDAVPGQELRCSMWARGRTFGTAAHPHGGLQHLFVGVSADPADTRRAGEGNGGLQPRGGHRALARR